MFARKPVIFSAIIGLCAGLAACGGQGKEAESADEFAARINGQQPVSRATTGTADSTASAESKAAEPPAALPSPGIGAGSMDPLAQPGTSLAACGASQVSSYVGREATPQLRAELAKAASIADVIRFRAPGPFITADNRDDRLNVMLDDRNIIRGFKCQ